MIAPARPRAARPRRSGRSGRAPPPIRAIGIGAARRRSRRHYAPALIGCLAGLALLYASGALWLAGYLHVSPPRALALGVLPYIPLDLLKAALVCAIARRVNAGGEPADI